MAVLTLEAHTAAPRQECTRAVADAVQAAGGFLTDVRQYSNVALLLRFEVPPVGLATLGERLAAVGVHLDVASQAALAAVRPATSADVEGTLHLRFYHAEPDLRIPTPAVPG